MPPLWTVVRLLNSAKVCTTRRPNRAVDVFRREQAQVSDARNTAEPALSQSQYVGVATCSQKKLPAQSHAHGSSHRSTLHSPSPIGRLHSRAPAAVAFEQRHASPVLTQAEPWGGDAVRRVVAPGMAAWAVERRTTIDRAGTRGMPRILLLWEATCSPGLRLLQGAGRLG